MVALTSSTGLVVPRLLVRMSRMPAASQTARTASPAITPVPGPAGINITLAAPFASLHHVRDRAVLNGHLDHVAGGLLDRLFDAGRHFVGLAIAPADAAFPIADDDHGGEAKAASTFDHGGAAFDLHDAFF